MGLRVCKEQEGVLDHAAVSVSLDEAWCKSKVGDHTATGGGGSLLAFSPFLVLKLLIRWAGKWASKVWTHSVSERIFPFTAPRGLIRCFLDDSVWRIGSG